jgi:hypothetical protein
MSRRLASISKCLEPPRTHRKLSRIRPVFLNWAKTSRVKSPTTLAEAVSKSSQSLKTQFSQGKSILVVGSRC